MLCETVIVLQSLAFYKLIGIIRYYILVLVELKIEVYRNINNIIAINSAGSK